MAKITAVVSGGLDSTTMLYELRDKGHGIVQAVSFNYGQRHKKELEYAAQACEELHIPWNLVDLYLAGLPRLLAQGGTSLISHTQDGDVQTPEVPEGHYAQENMKSTVVPNRNMIMLSIAGGIAVANGSNQVAVGVHAGDHFIYPDCRPEFISYAWQALYSGNEGFGDLWVEAIRAPFAFISKADIASLALTLGVPIERTWSCYKGGKIHCGRCGTCVERLEAIDEAAKRLYKGAYTDPTEYADREFWKLSVEEASGHRS